MDYDFQDYKKEATWRKIPDVQKAALTEARALALPQQGAAL